MALIPWLVDQFSNEPTRQEKLQGLLGSYGQMPEIGPGGMDPQQFVQSQQMQPGSPLAQAEMFGGMLDAGYNAQEAGSLMGLLNPQQQQDPTTFQRNFAAYQAADEPTRQLMNEYRKSGAMNINMGGGLGGLLTEEEKIAANLPVESVYQYDSKGQIKNVSNAKYTPAQNKAAGYAARMVQANNEMENIEANLAFDPTSMQQNVNELGVPDMLANMIRTPEQQVYEQAKQNWGSANLRDESGAVLGAKEMADELRKYFPGYDDSPEQVASKRRARKTLEAAQISKAGGAYQELQDTLDRQRLEEGRKRRGIK